MPTTGKMSNRADYYEGVADGREDYYAENDPARGPENDDAPGGDAGAAADPGAPEEGWVPRRLGLVVSSLPSDAWHAFDRQLDPVPTQLDPTGLRDHVH